MSRFEEKDPIPHLPLKDRGEKAGPPSPGWLSAPRGPRLHRPTLHTDTEARARSRTEVPLPPLFAGAEGPRARAARCCPMLGGAGGESLATRLTRFHGDGSQRTLTAGWTSPDARLRPETETGRLWFHAGSPGLQQRNPDMRSKIRFQAEEKLNL